MVRIGFFVAAIVVFAFPAFSRTAITFEADAVVARVTPGARTAWFFVIHDRVGYRPRITDSAFVLDDDDGDGIVRFAVDRPSRPSVWMVVDMRNGDAAIASPENHRLRRRPLPLGALRGRGNEPSASIHQGQNSAVIWLVRPRVGAWAGVVEDGSPEDRDLAVNGHVVVRLEDLAALGDSPEAPDDVRRDDTLAVVDPMSLDILDVRVR